MVNIEHITVENVRHKISRRAALVFEDATIEKVVQVILKDPKTRCVYTIDKEGKLTGIITLTTLAKYALRSSVPHPLWNFRTIDFVADHLAGTIKTEPIFVHDRDDLETAFQKMFNHDLEELPVIDENGKVIGNLDMLELLTTTLQERK